MKVVQLIADDDLVFGKLFDPDIQLVTLSNPSRTEVRDGNGAWLATFTNGSRTVSVKGARRTFVQRDVPLVDDFTRTRAGTGWGLSTFGGTWTLVGGTDPGNYSVNGTEGEVVVDTVNVSRRLYLSPQLSNADVKVRVKSDKLAVADNHGASILLNYVDSSNHHLVKMDFVPGSITDLFSRTAASGWGSATSGQAWTTSGGSASDYSVASGEGVHGAGVVNSSRRTLIGSMVDSDVTVRLRTSALASGASMTASLLSRYVDTSNSYMFRVRFSTTQQVFAAIQKQVAGTTSDIAAETQVAGLPHAAGTYVRVRARNVGNQLQMKVWADGANEPASWLLTTTDSSFTAAGKVGFRSILQTGSSNTLPVSFGYDDFNCAVETGLDAVELRAQKRVGGTTTTLGTGTTMAGLSHVANIYIWMRARVNNGAIEAKAWPDGSPEPASWALSQADASFASGKVGLRAVAEANATNAPIKLTFDDFYATGIPVSPPTVQHDRWVRVLPAAFSGTVDTDWLRDALNDTRPDALSIAMEYVNQAPALTSGALQISGDSHYGPLTATGARDEGGDFNDYLGITWTYSGPDFAEGAEFKCLDCSGYVRMVYGYRLGLPMRLSAIDGLSIPRTSSAISTGALGALIVPNTGTQITDFSKLVPGDIVFFDADTSNPDENEGQIDHVGIYMGADINGDHRFVSSRKSSDGPTFSDLGGPSILNGNGLYARTFRSIRRF